MLRAHRSKVFDFNSYVFLLRRSMRPGGMMKSEWKKYLPWLLFIAVAAILVALFQHQQNRTPVREITFSELLIQVDDGHVHDVTISGNEIIGHFNDCLLYTSDAADE